MQMQLFNNKKRIFTSYSHNFSFNSTRRLCITFLNLFPIIIFQIEINYCILLPRIRHHKFVRLLKKYKQLLFCEETPSLSVEALWVSVELPAGRCRGSSRSLPRVFAVGLRWTHATCRFKYHNLTQS